MTRAGKVTNKDRLLAEVFGFDHPVGPNTLELYIARLRKRLEPDGPAIPTVRGVGYMLEASCGRRTRRHWAKDFSSVSSSRA